MQGRSCSQEEEDTREDGADLGDALLVLLPAAAATSSLSSTSMAARPSQAQRLFGCFCDPSLALPVGRPEALVPPPFFASGANPGEAARPGPSGKTIRFEMAGWQDAVKLDADKDGFVMRSEASSPNNFENVA